jgi:two-component sensor histidine kinase
VSTIGRAYERLAYDADGEKIGLVAYIREVLTDLEAAVAPCGLVLEAPEEIQIASDRAILIALIINELVLNAAKHAYPDPSGKKISVGVVRSDNTMLVVAVSDEGVGLPAGFDPAKSVRLGTRLVAALSQQLNAVMTHPASTRGATFTLRVPLERRD